MGKKEVYKVGKLTEGKQELIRGLIEEYDIKSASDMQEALKDLLGGMLKSMLEAEMDAHLGYEKSERSDSDDYRKRHRYENLRLRG